MFNRSISTVPYTDPWNLTLSTRIAMLVRKRYRVAYLYHCPDNSTFRYRVYNMVQALNRLSSDVSAAWFCLDDDSALLAIVELCDVLVICRLQYSTLIGRLINRARQRGCRVIFDIDDLVFNPTFVEMIMITLDQDMADSRLWDYWYSYTGRINSTLGMCDYSIATNSFLAAKIQECSGKPAYVIPNFMNAEQLSFSSQIYEAKRKSRFERDRRIHVGYFSGSPSHDKDFLIVAPSLATLMEENSAVNIRLCGFVRPDLLAERYADRVEVLPFTDFVNLQAFIGAIEVNIVPLQDNMFTNCKSELKFFEAGIVGTMTIAAPTHTFQRVIQDNVNGFLSAEYEWGVKLRSAIDLLRGGGDKYIELVERAHDMSEQKFSYVYQVDLIKEVLFESSPKMSVSLAQLYAEDRYENITNYKPRANVLLSLFDPAGFGLEIGPGYNPLLPKAAGYRVETLDYTDRAGLVKKYFGNDQVDINKIEDVDYVTDGKPILEVILHRGRYDHIIASHVLEHVPDLISFFKSCEELLSEGGMLVLAIPDKRYCFDLLQPLSSTGDVLQAYIEKRQRPTPGKVFDSVAYDVLRAGLQCWTRDQAAVPTFNATLGRAKEIFSNACNSDAYIDVHVWRFVPSSFRLLIEDLNALGVISLRESGFILGGAEFYAALSKKGLGPSVNRTDLALAAARELADIRLPREPLNSLSNVTHRGQ